LGGTTGSLTRPKRLLVAVFFILIIGGEEMIEKLIEIAERIRGLRDIMEISLEEMAAIADVSVEEYIEYEKGQKDFSFTFLYNVAKKLDVDITDLMTGEAPKLSSFSIVRAGKGLPIIRRNGFMYQNMAYLFKDRIAEPFLVKMPFDKEIASSPLVLNHHEGQEFDYILSGKLRMRIDKSEFILNEGDAVYYDSSHGHGMAAIDGDCTMLAIVMEKQKKSGGQ
jgi:transcriptional regulator with XRE-family HTH domain